MHKKVAKARRFNATYEIVRTRTDQTASYNFFIKWYRNWFKSTQLQEHAGLSSLFYARALMRNGLKRLYANRTVSILKRNMQETADSYRKDNLTKKIFEHLLVHCYRNKTKTAMKGLADMHFRRNMMMKWLFLANQRRRAKDVLLAYDFSPRSTTRVKPLFTRGDTGLTAFSQNTAKSVQETDPTLEDPDAMKIDELDSTGEILAAHDAIEKQMHMLSNIHSSPSAASQISHSLSGVGGGIHPQKRALQNMMMHLKDRYKEVKDKKRHRNLNRSARLLNKMHSRRDTASSLETMEQKADRICNLSYMKRAFQALSVYTQDKHESFNQGVQARSHHNIHLKQKTFYHVKYWARRKAQNRDAIEVFRTVRRVALKRRVLERLRNRKDQGNLKHLQNEIAEEQFRFKRQAKIFNALHRRAKSAAHGDQLRGRWQKKRLHYHFKAWLGAANNQIVERGAGGGSRASSSRLNRITEQESPEDSFGGDGGFGAPPDTSEQFDRLEQQMMQFMGSRDEDTMARASLAGFEPGDEFRPDQPYNDYDEDDDEEERPSLKKKKTGM